MYIKLCSKLRWFEDDSLTYNSQHWGGLMMTLYDNKDMTVWETSHSMEQTCIDHYGILDISSQTSVCHYGMHVDIFDLVCLLLINMHKCITMIDFGGIISVVYMHMHTYQFDMSNITLYRYVYYVQCITLCLLCTIHHFLWCMCRGYFKNKYHM